jgi:rod shape-determining protein MreD
LTIPFAALTALIAALIETSVLPEIPIIGATADLVLVCAIAAGLVFGIDDGLAAAFLGGLLVDMLIPGRPLGAATLSLLLVTGVAVAAAHLLGPGRRGAAVLLTLALTVVYEGTLVIVLALTEKVPVTFNPTAIVVAAIMNAILVVPLVVVFGAIEQRFGPTERTPW